MLTAGVFMTCCWLTRVVGSDVWTFSVGFAVIGSLNVGWITGIGLTGLIASVGSGMIGISGIT